MKKFLIIFFVVMAQVCAGQPSITWQKVYEGPYNGDDIFWDVVGDNYGNFYLLGDTWLFPTSRFYIIKVNQYGDTLWSKIIGGYGHGQRAYSGICTPDGSLIFTGLRDTACSIHLSADGEILWDKTYSVSSSIFQSVALSDIIKTSDNGYIMCGKVFVSQRGCIVKIDSAGNLQWYRIYSAPFRKKFNKVIEVEGGYLIDGEADSTKGYTNTVFLKINFNGDTIWEKQYRLFIYGFFPSTMLLVNNRYWVFGERPGGLSFLKIDSSGVITDSVNIYSSISEFDTFRDAIKINNNKFVVTSMRTDYAEAKIIDSMGIIAQSKLFKGYPFIQFFGNQNEPNGDLIFAGLMYNFQKNSGTNSNGYVVRTDSNLNYPPVSILNYSNTITTDYSLLQNYPNPFNPQTTISFQIPEKSNIKILIYDIAGHLIEKLIDENINAGKYEIQWNGKNLNSGIYFINLLADGKLNKTIKAVYIK